MILVPLIPLAAACMMIGLALMFSLHRGLWFKRQLNRLWTKRRREVLHLDTQNGYYFLMEMLLWWAEGWLRISAVLALITILGRREIILPVVCMVSFGVAFRAAVLWYISHCRVELFGDLSGYDGYGTYWKARGDWLSLGFASRSTFFGSSVVLMVAILMLLTSI